MTDCELCHQQTLDGQILNMSGHHKICWAEWNKRFDAEKCVTCGKNSQAEGLIDCSNCFDTDADFRGYVGPKS